MKPNLPVAILTSFLGKKRSKVPVFIFSLRQVLFQQLLCALFTAKNAKNDLHLDFYGFLNWFWELRAHYLADYQFQKPHLRDDKRLLRLDLVPRENRKRHKRTRMKFRKPDFIKKK